MATITRLNEIFTNWAVASENSLFYKLERVSKEIPWAELNLEYVLNRDYFGRVSGQKIASPLVTGLYDYYKTLYDTDTALSETLDDVVDLAWWHYGTNWVEEWKTRNFEYNPIENYNMIETLVNEKESTTYGKKTETATENTQETTATSTGSGETQTYGFNSDTAVPQNASSNEDSTTQTATGSGTATQTDSGTDTREKTSTFTRNGNIGVMSTQSLILETRNLNAYWSFFNDVVYKNLDHILTLKIY